MDVGLLLLVLAVLALVLVPLCIAGLVVMVIWLVRRTQRPALAADASQTPAPPR